MPYTSFSDVGRLDASALRALLVGGEPPERVWAAWALGLLHDETFARDLRATAAEEPHPGVRRHLVVILAGAGEHRSLLTIGGHDPDERVRATALQYLARLARPGDAEANELLTETLAAGSPLLRLGCIAGLRADAPPALWRAAEDCIASPDRDLRWTAYESVIRQGPQGQTAAALARDLLNLEPEPKTRGDAARLLHDRVGVAALSQLAHDPRLKVDLLPELVEVMHERDVRLAWPEVERLMVRLSSDEARHRALQLLVAGGEGAARASLLKLFVADRIDSKSWWLTQDEVVTRLRRALDDNRAPLDESERDLHRTLADFVETAAADARTDPDYFDNIDDLDPDLLPAAVPGQPIDPLSLPWFCEHEREILARLAPLEVH
jgi:hypothetical protein